MSGAEIVPFPGESSPRTPPKRFIMEPCETFEIDQRGGDFLVSRTIPRCGVGVLCGVSGSFKSFVALDLTMRIALGWDWAGRSTERAPAIYIAAEGAAGMRKRRTAFLISHSGTSRKMPLDFICTAPNFGSGKDDLDELRATIEASGVAPGFIVVDTLSQSLAGADENGAGMVTFVNNVTALANHFGCFVLAVHHVALKDPDRMRGHSSLVGASDVVILCEKRSGEGTGVKLTVTKLKDEESGLVLEARLAKVTVGQYADGADMTSLVVGELEAKGFASGTKAKKEQRPSGAAKVALDALGKLVRKSGVALPPSDDVPTGVKAVLKTDWKAAAIAAEIANSDDPKAQSNAFGRAFNTLRDNKKIGAHAGYVWPIIAEHHRGTSSPL